MDYKNYLMKIKFPHIIESFAGKRKRLHVGLGSAKGVEDIKPLIRNLQQVTSDDSSLIHKVLKLLKPIITENREGLLVFHTGNEDNIDKDFIIVKPLALMSPDFILLSYESSINSELHKYMVQPEDTCMLILVDAERVVTYRLQDGRCNQMDDFQYQQDENHITPKHWVSSLLVFDQLKSKHCRGLVLGFQRGCEWLEDCLPEGVTPVRKQIIEDINDTTWEELVMSADMNSIQISREISLLGEFYKVLQTRQRSTALGLADTIEAVERGSVHTLILWEGLNLQRCVMVDQEDEELIDFLPEGQETPTKHPTSNRQLVTLRRTNLADWFDSLNKFSLVLVTNSSSYGQQFQGSGGIGALLKGFRPKGSRAPRL